MIEKIKKEMKIFLKKLNKFNLLFYKYIYPTGNSTRARVKCFSRAQTTVTVANMLFLSL